MVLMVWIEQIMDYGPWVSDFSQMCRKTVIRRLMNYLPLSIEIQRAVAIDSQNEGGKKDLSEFTGVIDAEFTQSETEDAPTADQAPKQSKLEKMAAKNKPAAPATVHCPDTEKDRPQADCETCRKREIDGTKCPAL